MATRHESPISAYLQRSTVTSIAEVTLMDWDLCLRRSPGSNSRPLQVDHYTLSYGLDFKPRSRLRSGMSNPNTTTCFVFNYENTPIQYTVIFKGCQNDYFQIKKCDIFLISAQKHRSWVHLRTASVSTHHLCFRAKIRKIYTPVKPSFTI